MNRSTFSILFYIKRSKLLKNGKAPVYLKITVNGKSSELSLKRCIEYRLWDTPRNCAKGNGTEARQLNVYLTSVRGQIYSHHKRLQENNQLVTSQDLANAFLGKGDKRWTLLELFTLHNEQMKKLIDVEYSPLTLQRHITAFKHIKKFFQNQNYSEDILVNHIDHKFICGFEMYLKSVASCQHNSAMKHMKSLKKIINNALANDIIRIDPFSNYKISTKEVVRECLTQTEIEILMKKDFTINRIEVVRDLFIFQCYTGLSYIDLSLLTSDNIEIGIDGFKWLYLKRKKTGNTCHIPLLPQAELIISKYSNYPPLLHTSKLLPVPSNQKMNAYLKEVGDLCCLKKSLHTHLARHTYATTITLSNDVPMEVVSKLLGHSKIQTTQIYSKVLDTKVSNEMASLRKKLA